MGANRSAAIADHKMNPDAPPSYYHDQVDYGQEAEFLDTCPVKLEPESVPVLHVIAKGMLEPLIPLMPEQSAPYVQEHALLLLMAFTVLFLVIFTGLFACCSTGCLQRHVFATPPRSHPTLQHL